MFVLASPNLNIVYLFQNNLNRICVNYLARVKYRFCLEKIIVFQQVNIKLRFPNNNVASDSLFPSSLRIVDLTQSRDFFKAFVHWVAGRIRKEVSRISASSISNIYKYFAACELEFYSQKHSSSFEQNPGISSGTFSKRQTNKHILIYGM